MEELVSTRKPRMDKAAPWALMAVGNMAVVLGALRQAEKAEILILDVLAIAKRNDDVGILFWKQILATILIQQERYLQRSRRITGQSDPRPKRHDIPNSWLSSR
ncbi:hypothetical protein F5Y09DRAFT_306666 [Xylaria sp. FL1042]|nr:hypothetical protein F5Y09DRAFT_306666 [Xylaria sp. FL1042]